MTPQTPSFAPTRWTMVLTAGGHDTAAQRALAELAHLYWFPLYAFIRRRGHAPAEAEDLTQDFFARLLEKKSLAAVDRAKGKFRSFLLASLKNFLCNAHDKAHAHKRGGHQRPIALDALAAESRYALEPTDTLTPERLFERRWALALLDHVLARLASDYAARNQSALFTALQPLLTAGDPAPRYAAFAASLGLTEGAVKTAAHRLRRRYRDLLRGEIAHTVATPDDIDAEIAYLLNCL